MRGPLDERPEAGRDFFVQLNPRARIGSRGAARTPQQPTKASSTSALSPKFTISSCRSPCVEKVPRSGTALQSRPDSGGLNAAERSSSRDAAQLRNIPWLSPLQRTTKPHGPWAASGPSKQTRYKPRKPSFAAWWSIHLLGAPAAALGTSKTKTASPIRARMKASEPRSGPGVSSCLAARCEMGPQPPGRWYASASCRSQSSSAAGVPSPPAASGGKQRRPPATIVPESR
mmetsp:Transcript_50033/g.131635  ORF Transcript_50033/g.131635 Transcript_50033/m.131635 type:complete len:230 (-) Transcript_50033:739-1428(-)